MEKSLSFLEKMKQEFACEKKDIRTYSPLTLAFVGDCVFDLIIRTVIVERANRSPHDLHKMKSAIVCGVTLIAFSICMITTFAFDDPMYDLNHVRVPELPKVRKKYEDFRQPFQDKYSQRQNYRVSG